MTRRDALKTFLEVPLLGTWDIDACACVLVRYESPSVGTAMEVLYAWERDKHIVLWVDSETTLSPWLQYHVSEIQYSLENAVKGCKRAVNLALQNQRESALRREQFFYRGVQPCGSGTEGAAGTAGEAQR